LYNLREGRGAFYQPSTPKTNNSINPPLNGKPQGTFFPVDKSQSRSKLLVVGGQVYEIVCVGQKLLVKPAPTASKTLAQFI
jgi:hypothetical protein